MPALPAQIPVYDRTRAANHAMGTRARARSGAAASRLEPAGDARTPRDSRASLRYAQDADATHFLTKRLPKVATEMALHVLAYNLTRAMNILGVKPLIAAIQT